VFQNLVYDTRADAFSAVRGDIELVVSEDGYVYNDRYEPDKCRYLSAYDNDQGFSERYSGHLEYVKAIVLRTLGSSSLFEIGCGHGLFVQMLSEAGAEIRGCDPSHSKSHPLVQQCYFDEVNDGSFNGLILRHTLEHVPDPFGFLENVRTLNGGRGRIYIEVPSLEWILANNAWYDITYEHVNYFSESTFRGWFTRIDEIGFSFGGQYLYVVADLASLCDAPIIELPNISSAFDSLVSVKQPILEELASLREINGSGLALWGGAGKGVMILHHMSSLGFEPEFVVDINPQKIGKFVAGGYNISSPSSIAELSEPIDILVANVNYVAEIRSIVGAKNRLLTIGRAQLILN